MHALQFKINIEESIIRCLFGETVSHLGLVLIFFNEIKSFDHNRPSLGPECPLKNWLWSSTEANKILLKKILGLSVGVKELDSK